jgi:hypothetical protein
VCAALALGCMRRRKDDKTPGIDGGRTSHHVPDATRWMLWWMRSADAIVTISFEQLAGPSGRQNPPPRAPIR